MLRHTGEAFFRPLFVLLGLIAVLVLALVAGIVLLNGRLGIASFLVLTATLVSLYWPIAAWLQGRRTLRRAGEAATHVFAFLDRPGGVGQMVGAEFLPGLNALLEFENVTLKEPGSNKLLLEDVDLTIEAGQRIALMGNENGAKHAFVHLIPRFLDPAAGEVRIDRKNLRFVTLDSLRAQVGVVLQNHLVFNDTIANNIGCGESTYTLPKIIEAAKVAHAHQFIQKLPLGYETVIGEMGHRLSVGERFRIGLARALLRDPSLYIIEEPLQPLDADTKTLLDDTFSRILPDHTAIFLPHRLSTIRSCDRILVFDGAKISADGEHTTLLEKSDLYRHLQYQEFNEFAGR